MEVDEVGTSAVTGVLDSATGKIDTAVGGAPESVGRRRMVTSHLISPSDGGAQTTSTVNAPSGTRSSLMREEEVKRGIGVICDVFALVLLFVR